MTRAHAETTQEQGARRQAAITPGRGEGGVVKTTRECLDELFTEIMSIWPAAHPNSAKTPVTY